MKKNVLAIGIIVLFIGIAAMPACSALPGIFYPTAQVDGTVNELHKERIFIWHAHAPINLAVKGLIRHVNINIDGGISWSFSVRFAKWDEGYPYEDAEQPGVWHIKGTVYMLSIRNIEG